MSSYRLLLSQWFKYILIKSRRYLQSLCGLWSYLRRLRLRLDSTEPEPTFGLHRNIKDNFSVLPGPLHVEPLDGLHHGDGGTSIHSQTTMTAPQEMRLVPVRRQSTPHPAHGLDADPNGPPHRGDNASRAFPPRPRRSHKTTLALRAASLLPKLPELSPTSQNSPERTLQPILPEFLSRYETNASVKHSKKESQYVITSMTLEFTRNDIPREWTAYTHPEGALYFYHSQRKIITDAYICDPHVFSELEAFIFEMDRFIEQNKVRLPPDVDLVMELSSPDNTGEIKCGYYFVEHKSRVLFWLHDYEIDDLLYGVWGVSSPTHIKHVIEWQYWLHWEYYPNPRSLSETEVNELKRIIAYNLADSMTSSEGTAPYSSDKLESMLGLISGLDPQQDVKHDDGYRECAFGRIMAIFVHQRFLNFHSQQGARLNRSQSLYGVSAPTRSPIFTVLNPTLFFTPERYMQLFEWAWIDDLGAEGPWLVFVKKLTNDLQSFTLFGTVILNANVAFLAVPGVDNAGGAQTLAQIASYVSVVTSLGSIIIGLTLSRQNTAKGRESLDDAFALLFNAQSTILGFETYALIYSLPYGLLVWSTTFFLLAFSALSFTVTDRRTRFIIGAAWVLIALLTAWCIQSGWEMPRRAKKISIWKALGRLIEGWLQRWTKGEKDAEGGDEKIEVEV